MIAPPTFPRMQRAVESVNRFDVMGRVAEVVGLVIESIGPNARVGDVWSLLRGPRHLHVPLYRANRGHAVGGGRPLQKPAFHDHRRGHPDPDHPCLHCLCLLGLPGESRSRGGVPLMASRSRYSRWLWFIGLWVASVSVLAMVALVIRLAIS